MSDSGSEDRCVFFSSLHDDHSFKSLWVCLKKVLILTVSLKAFIVEDFSSDDDFLEKKPMFKGKSDITTAILMH